MSDTVAVPLADFERVAMSGRGNAQPLCPSCNGGRLHPYRVTMTVPRNSGDWLGLNLEGWVAVCVGNGDYRRAMLELFPDDEGTDEAPNEVEPCGFSMALQPVPS